MVVREQRFSFNHVRQVLGGVLEHDLHAKRVDSLCDATLGVMRSASLAVCMIGQGLAAARGLNPKHATKQVDRLLSNPKINVDDILARWVPYVIGARNAASAVTLPSPLRREKPAPPPPWCDRTDAHARLRGAAVTADRYPVGTVVCVQDRDMKQARWQRRQRPVR